MRGVGGPLLCIGDLLSDVAEDDDKQVGTHHVDSPSLPSSPAVRFTDDLHQQPSDLRRLFEDSYKELMDSLSDNSGHSWTSLTLKLCAAIKTADDLVKSADSNVDSILEKVKQLEIILNRGDLTVSRAVRIAKS